MQEEYTESLVVIELNSSEEEEVKVEIPEEPTSGDGKSFKFSWRKMLAYTGPGWLMSMAYLDPGNLESDLQAGAYAGYQLIWVLFASTIAGLLLQILAARLGVVTKKNLAEVCRANYPRPAVYALWLMTEIAIIASDIQEVLGSAIAIQILFGLPLWGGCLITGFDTFTFMLIHYFGIRKLELLFGFLIFIMVICFYIDWFDIGGDAGAVLYGWWAPVEVFEPNHQYSLYQAVGILGAVIMPHNIYLHSALVQSRKIDRTSVTGIQEANYYNAIESTVALLVAFFINLAVVAVFAEGFFDSTCAEQGYQTQQINLACVDGRLDEYSQGGSSTTYNISQSCQDRYQGFGTCAEIGLAVAGDALKSVLKDSGKYFWAIGLFASGQASTMTGTFAGQYVMQGFLNLQLPIWKRVLLTRSIALVPAVLVALATAKDRSLSDRLGEWLNILQSVQLPFALLPLVLFTSSERIMGPFKNGPITKTLVWSLSALAMFINMYLIYSFIFQGDGSVPTDTWFYALVGILFFGYIFFILFLLKDSFHNLVKYWKKHANAAKTRTESGFVAIK